MHKLSNIVILLICVCFFDCNKQINAIDRIKKELPIQANGKLIRIMPARYDDSSISWEMSMKRKNTLGLLPIESGKEGFQVRIWESYHNNAGVLLILDYSNNKWSAKGYSYKAYSKDGSLPDSLVGNDLSLTEPVSGWEKFMNKLLDENLLTLRDYDDIPDYFVATDMVGHLVEIASPNYYRLYELPNAKHQPAKIADVESILKIAALIKKEFPKLF